MAWQLALVVGGAGGPQLTNHPGLLGTEVAHEQAEQADPALRARDDIPIGGILDAGWPQSPPRWTQGSSTGYRQPSPGNTSSSATLRVPTGCTNRARSTSRISSRISAGTCPLFGPRRYFVQACAGTLLADPDQLTQVLRNLVRNAVNHTDPGGKITVTAQSRGGRLLIVVADRGTGIPPDQLPHIFERFHRTNSGRQRDRVGSGSGSGLGLPIARTLVEAHGGRIWAQSRLAEGTRLSIELPGYDPASQQAPVRDDQLLRDPVDRDVGSGPGRSTTNASLTGL
jgi:hypothetical protein